MPNVLEHAIAALDARDRIAAADGSNATVQRAFRRVVAGADYLEDRQKIELIADLDRELEDLGL